MKDMKKMALNECRIVYILLSFICFIGCKEGVVNTPIGKGQVPERVTNVQVKSLSGAAEITYSLPEKNTTYVLAEYEIRPGEKRQAKSSKYKNTIRIEGFSKEGDYKVQLYSMGTGEEKSEPVEVTVTVLPTPIQIAYNSVELFDDFGGMRVEIDNSQKGDLVVEVLTPDNNSQLESVYSHYTSQENVVFSVRGYEPINREFGITLRDRWGNQSDTLFAQVKPLFEEELDRRIMKQYRLPNGSSLPGDNTAGHSWGGNTPREMHFLFDGVASNPNDVFHTLVNSGVPTQFTFDLGKVAKLSRFKIWQRRVADHYFAGSAPRNFRLWGSNSPNPNGSFDESWTMLGEFEIIKPSGLPIFENSSEDIASVVNGSEFNIPTEKEAIRYIRLEVRDTWGNYQYITIAELAFWGTYQ